MKKLIGLAAFLLLAASVSAQPDLCPTDTLTFPLYALDSVGSMIGYVDTALFMVTGPKGDSIKAEAIGIAWVGDSLQGTVWRVKRHRWAARRCDTTYTAFALVSNIVASSTRYGLYSVQVALHSNDAKSKQLTPTGVSFNLVKYSPNRTSIVIVDSTASVGYAAGLSADSVMKRDSTRAVSGGAGTFGFKGMQDVSATFTLSAANIGAMADSVWKYPITGVAFGAAGFTAGRAGAYQRLAGDSTTFENSLEVWKHRFDTVGLVAGSIGDSLNNPSYVGNVYSIGGPTNTASATGLNLAFGGTGGGTMKLLQLDIGGAAGANGGLYVHNSTGPAIYGYTNSSGANAMKLEAQGSGSGTALYLQGAPNGGKGLVASGAGVNGFGIYVNTTGTGAAIYGTAPTGPAMVMTSQGADAVQFTSTGGGGTGFRAKGNAGGSGAAFESGSSGYAISAISTGNVGIYAEGALNGISTWGHSGSGFYGRGFIAGFEGISDGLGPGFAGVMDSVEGVGGGGGGTGNDTSIINLMLDSAQQHPEIFGGVSGIDEELIAGALMDSIRGNSSMFGCVGSGSGPDIWNLYVMDTTYSELQSGVAVAAYTPTGTPMASVYTNTYGLAVLNLSPGAYDLVISKSGIYMTAKRLTLTTNMQVDTLKAWKARIPSAPWPNQSAVFMQYFSKAVGGSLQGVKFVIYNNNVITDTVHHTIFGPWRDEATTDFYGKAVVQTPKSYQFSPAAKAVYTLELWKSGVMIWQRTKQTVTDVDTMRVSNVGVTP